MIRGGVRTASGGSDYACKPRPVVIVQDSAFSQIDSVTICSFTTDPLSMPIFRVLVEPTSGNGLLRPSRAMVDKITTIPRTKIGRWIGHLEARDLARIDEAIIVFLGLTDRWSTLGSRKA